MSRTVSTIDYKELAERLSRLADELAAFGHHTSEQRVDDLRTVASLLEGMADKKPSAFAHRDAMGSPYVENWDDDIYALCGDINLYLHPAPQPQPERQPVSEAHREAVLGAVARGWCHPENANKEMDATLAIAIADEVLAINRSEPTEAQIEAAEAKPVAWMDEFGNAFPLDAWKPAKRAGYLDYHKKAWKPLFTHPEPQPQPEQERSEQEEEG